MKIIKAINLDKYSDHKRYTPYAGFVYQDVAGGNSGTMGIASSPLYCVTLCAELEDGEDTQYPPEDLLDKYRVNCTEVMEVKEEAGRRYFVFEVESWNAEKIKTVAGLTGKRVYNYKDGDLIRLAVE